MAFDLPAYARYLTGLYQRQLAQTASPYLRAHSLTPGGVLRQVQVCRLYLPLVTGRVLDWGCFHAPDACLVRKYCGPEVEIHGCDIHPASLDCFGVFHQAAQLQYRQVKHPYCLPYEDNFFDTLIAGGVLEHVPNDAESLKELYRVLKPDGLLVLGFLPNALSYLEAAARWFRLPHHLRTYTMGMARRLLLHSGFQPISARYLQMTPTLSGLGLIPKARWLVPVAFLMWKLNTFLEHLWPVNRLASNLFLLARKRRVITWAPEYVQEARAKSRAA